VTTTKRDHHQALRIVTKRASESSSLLAIDRIRTVSRGDVLIETQEPAPASLATVEIERPGGPFGLVSRDAGLEAIQGVRAAPQDQSNWFGPNIAAVIEPFETAGLRLPHLDSWEFGARSSFRATAVPLPSRLVDATYEGFPGLNADLTGIKQKNADLFRRDRQI
jgi:hypothetical protein